MSELVATIEQALELFAPLGPLNARKMFGGAGIYAEGVMFALIAYGDIYIKADEALAAEMEDAGSEGPFVYEGKGKPAIMRYWRLPDSALDEPDEAVRWGRRGVAVALAARR